MGELPAGRRRLVLCGPAPDLAGLSTTPTVAESEALQEVLTPCQARQMRRNLEYLAQIVSAQPYLEGTQLSLADLAVVAQLSLLKFPAFSGAPLADRGVEGIANNPVLEPLFAWRDRIIEETGRA